MFLTMPSITWPSASDWIRPLRCSARVSSRIARRNTTILPRRRSILRIWNGCGRSISGPTSRTGRMSTCEPGRKATAPPRSTVKPPFTRPKMMPSTRLPAENSPSSLSHAASRRGRRGGAAGAVARQHRLARGILDAVDIDFDLVTDRKLGLLARRCELAQRHPAFGLQAHVNHRHVVLDRGDCALDDLALERLIFTAEAFVEQFREIVAGGKCRGSHKVGCLSYLRIRLPPPATLAGLPSSGPGQTLAAPAAPCGRSIQWDGCSRGHPRKKARLSTGMSPEPNALAKKRASTNDLSVRRTGRALDQRGWESKVHAKAR